MTFPDNMKTPESIVQLFIHTHAEWNRRSNERCKTLRPGSTEDQHAMETAKSEYNEIIKRFGSKNVVPQPISFGDNPMHDPERESIESTAIDGASVTVRTRHVDIHDLVSIYEYRLVQESNEWRISSLLYNDEKGSYECL